MTEIFGNFSFFLSFPTPQKSSFLPKSFNALIFPLNTNANTYEELLEVINCLKKNWVGFSDEFFVNKSKKYEYILTKLEGKKRNELLGITDQMYENQELAKKWFKNIAKYIHPDTEGIDKDAFIVLKKLYDTMIEE